MTAKKLIARLQQIQQDSGDDDIQITINTATGIRAVSDDDVQWGRGYKLDNTDGGAFSDDDNWIVVIY